MTIEHKKTGKSLRYVIPSSTRSLLDRWNQDLNERQRYDAVMDATASSLFNMTANPNFYPIFPINKHLI
ncbi:MAG: hypothetical protein QNJ72_05585 [Pleurocapsa sp. MO_226.B13]|nr:hypothetical protein [Pleurocapsa sp. MO_226.B13]